DDRITEIPERQILGHGPVRGDHHRDVHRDAPEQGRIRLAHAFEQREGLNGKIDFARRWFELRPRRTNFGEVRAGGLHEIERLVYPGHAAELTERQSDERGAKISRLGRCVDARGDDRRDGAEHPRPVAEHTVSHLSLYLLSSPKSLSGGQAASSTESAGSQTLCPAPLRTCAGRRRMPALNNPIAPVASRFRA